jgi:peptide/nickel transport system permease protein
MNADVVGTTLPLLVRSLRRDRAAMLGWLLMLLWLGMAALGPLVVSSDPNKQDLANVLLPPAWMMRGVPMHPLGTDFLGRDILARIVHGARVSLMISVVAVALAVTLGSLAGTFAAEWRGWVDEMIMRLADIQLSIPFMLLAVTVLAILGRSLVNMVLVLVLSGWVIYARVVRSAMLYLRESEFILAARAIGASRVRIVLHHLLPNAIGLLVVVATFELSNIVILEAALSFLGLGIRPPLVSWGTMLSDGRNYLASAWWLAAMPGVAITLTVLGVNLVGDWMRDVLDPRHRKD